MAEEKKQEKKIIIDEDWKNKAQKEKDVLKEKEEVEKSAVDKASIFAKATTDKLADREDNGAKQEEPYQLPTGDFGSLVSLLATQAMFAMGIITTEKDKEPKKDLRLAKFHIDMLETIEEKTKGNLTEQEQKFLSGTLSQLRMGFVNATG